MKRMLPLIAVLMLAACGTCGEQCSPHSNSKYGHCEHCATGKGECVCPKDGAKHAH